MLTVFFVLLLLWALGFISGYTFGGLIHLLLIFALVAILIRVIQGRKAI